MTRTAKQPERERAIFAIRDQSALIHEKRREKLDRRILQRRRIEARVR